MTKKRVFISSAYTHGDQAANVRLQHDLFHILLQLGHIPFAPLTSHYHELIYPTNYDVWMEWCKYWITPCDYVLRVPGDSPGAVKECEHAIWNDIPIISTREQFTDILCGDEPMCLEIKDQVLLLKLLDRFDD